MNIVCPSQNRVLAIGPFDSKVRAGCSTTAHGGRSLQAVASFKRRPNTLWRPRASAGSVFRGRGVRMRFAGASVRAVRSRLEVIGSLAVFAQRGLQVDDALTQAPINGHVELNDSGPRRISHDRFLDDALALGCRRAAPCVPRNLRCVSHACARLSEPQHFITPRATAIAPTRPPCCGRRHL